MIRTDINVKSSICKLSTRNPCLRGNGFLTYYQTYSKVMFKVINERFDIRMFEKKNTCKDSSPNNLCFNVGPSPQKF